MFLNRGKIYKRDLHYKRQPHRVLTYIYFLITYTIINKDI